MRVALIQCPAFGIDRPPLALGYLAAFLRKEGWEVDIFDFNVELYSVTEESNKNLWDFQNVFQWIDKGYFSQQSLLPKECFKDWARRVSAGNPEIVGFSVQSSSLEASIYLAKELKAILPETIVVFGGPLNLSYSVEHAYYLLGRESDPGVKVVNVIVLGEGEETLGEIVSRKVEGKSLRGCAGTIVRTEGGFSHNSLRPLIKDLDALPFPEFKGLPPVYKYKSRIPILGSRGCLYKCVFCDDTLIWQKYRYRSAANIVREMVIRKEEGVEFLEFNDLLINGNIRQLGQLSDLLIKEKLNIPWGASAVVNRNLDLAFLKKLKKAGCHYLNYGIESASPKVLREMNKSFTVEQIRRVIYDTYQAGISVCTNWIVGFPTETRDDFQVTLDFVRENAEYFKNQIMVNSFILKGTSYLYDKQEQFGIVSDQTRKWYSQNGANDIQERQRRFNEFLRLIHELGDRPVHQTFQG